MKSAIVSVLGALGLAAVGLGACSEQPHFAKAYRATSPDQLIGGDVAMARLGDFILENDKVRFAILDKDSSPAPGVFGGTLVDADLQRPEAQFRNGSGQDQLAEVIPTANLLWPRPGAGQVSIIADGSDGGPAIVRVIGQGGVFLEALSILTGDLVATFFPGVRFSLRIETDYILEPGKSYLHLKSTAYRTDPEAPTTITESLPLPTLTAPLPIFTTMLGDQATELQPGVMAGDFLFFGARNDIFAPGIGFDEEKPIFDALFEGRDTFTHPLAFDYMAAAGGPVSYGYFSLRNAGGPDPKVLVPIITSSSTGFITAAKNCSTLADDDETCDRFAAFTWDRYLAVGKGDIASIADIVYEAQGIETGAIRGVVRNGTGAPLPNGHVNVMRDPDPTAPLTDTYALAEANYKAFGDPGLIGVVDADVGRDPIEDGDFRATLRPGDYVVFAQNEDRTMTGGMQRIRVVAGETIELAPMVPAPAKVRLHIVDAGGSAVDAKVTFVPILADGTKADFDGLRRPWLAEGRLGNGARYVVPVISEDTTVEVEPGRYEVTASHGPTWSTGTQIIEVTSGLEARVNLTVQREVDTTGWISGDFHLHAEASFDSGMKFAERLRRILIEGIDLAVSTDHDIVADYGPAVRALGAQNRIKTGIGVEMSSLELGHFIAFPLSYDRLKIPDHGAPDWTCLDGPGLLSLLQSRIADPKGGVRIMAHPRDGFIGHISQIGLNGTATARALSLLEKQNVLLSRTSCEIDAMEVFNGKRFDLVRSPTNREVILYNRCMGRIDAAIDASELDVACPELSATPLATCKSDERLSECKQHYRRELAYRSARDILIRTPEEQAANWAHAPSAADDANCDPKRFTDEVPSDVADLPCSYHIGTYDDWMHWLDLGLNVTITGASDTHGVSREPGTPRTWVRYDATSPAEIDVGVAARRVNDGHALASFGPLVDAEVSGQGPGDVAKVSGATFTLDLRVQTASWFGVDRIEIYVSGTLAKVITLEGGADVVEDFNAPVELPVPARDGFVSVITMGTRKDLLMRQVLFDVPFGELQLPRVASLAFASIPAFGLVFSPTPSVPDFFPTFPLAATNAILLDVDGDGKWTPPGPLPFFCKRGCDPNATQSSCVADEVCLDSAECALPIDAECRTGPPGTEGRTQLTHD